MLWANLWGEFDVLPPGSVEGLLIMVAVWWWALVKTTPTATTLHQWSRTNLQDLSPPSPTGTCLETRVPCPRNPVTGRTSSAGAPAQKATTMFPVGRPPGATVGDLTGSTELLVPGRVVASTHIPQGVVSVPISPESLRGITDVVQISVGVDVKDTLELDRMSRTLWSKEMHWVRAIRLADDCHSYNVLLRKLPVPSNNDASANEPAMMVLQVVRSVSVGQELLLWFSEDILASLHMGFLVPANIQGQKNYVCTRCSALYESPNPLKLHLTLSCGKYSIPTLWEKLAQSVSNSNTWTTNEFTFKLSEPVSPKQRSAIDLSTPVEKKLKHDEIYRPYAHSSAFKPFQRLDNNNSICSQQSQPQNYLQWPRFTMPRDYMRTSLLVSHNCDNEAQIETLVSSLGKFKEGHICLYCGKSYSRKYGLKIHIRTHTGYKPLKCKYCLRPFGDPSNLNKHVRLHAEGETPYKCELCGKVLVRRRDLERHLRSRHMSDMSPTVSVTDEESNGTSVDVSDEEQDKEAN